MNLRGIDVRKEKIKLLIRDIKKFDKLANKVESLFGSTGGTFDGLSYIMEHYIESISTIIGDKSSWIYWYIFDNNMGNNRLRVEVGDFSKRVTSINDILWVIDTENSLEKEIQ